jgi:CHAT domain-containing protein
LEQPQYLAIRAAKPVALSELQQKLSAQTALVEFIFVGEKVFALVVTQKNLQSVLLPVSKSNLAAKTKLLRSLVFTKAEKENDWLPVAESLRAGLIEPMEKSGALNDIKRIGFVPYSFLHDLPFAALVRRENEKTKFLIEDYTLFQTPSATFYANKEITHPPATAGGTDTSLQSNLTIAFGRNSSNEENLPALDFAEEEAKTVAQTTRGAAFVNKQATETELKQLAYNCDYLHLSTHAIAESDMPLFSHILLEPTETDDGQLTVREIFELGLRTKLVTLSACETGRSFSSSGNDSTEQDRVGLIEAFLHAGSKSVLASLFPVSDKPTAKFMNTFYQNLHKQDKAESLSQTQRSMIRDDKLKHPRYWSSFILVGTAR